MSRERSPASTCATRMSSFLAVTAQASVELTSPTTMAQLGQRSRQNLSNAIMTRAVCSAWEPEPTSRFTSGGGNPRSLKNRSDMLP